MHDRNPAGAVMTNEYLITPALYHRPGEGPPKWECRCVRPDGRRLLRKHRHTSESDCQPQAEVDAFRARHGLKGPDSHVRALLFIEGFSAASDSANPALCGALNTHGQTETCLEHGSQLSSGKGHAGISPQASGQSDQEAERLAAYFSPIPEPERGE